MHSDDGWHIVTRMQPTLIKRYGADRLYDPAALRYVGLADLADLILNGQRFIVVDAKTGNDVTRELLDRLR